MMKDLGLELRFVQVGLATHKLQQLQAIEEDIVQVAVEELHMG